MLCILAAYIYVPDLKSSNYCSAGTLEPLWFLSHFPQRFQVIAVMEDLLHQLRLVFLHLEAIQLREIRVHLCDVPILTEKFSWLIVL